MQTEATNSRTAEVDSRMPHEEEIGYLAISTGWPGDLVDVSSTGEAVNDKGSALAWDRIGGYGDLETLFFA